MLTLVSRNEAEKASIAAEELHAVEGEPDMFVCSPEDVESFGIVQLIRAEGKLEGAIQFLERIRGEKDSAAPEKMNSMLGHVLRLLTEVNICVDKVRSYIPVSPLGLPKITPQ